MNKKRKDSLYGSLLLCITAIIWGSAFAAQSTGAEYLGPFTFTAFRSLLGAVALLPVILVMDTVKKRRAPEAYRKMTKKDYKLLIGGGVSCGTALCVASSLQQLGIDGGTPAGNAAFITALYILLVPIFSLFLGKKVRPIIWGCVVVSIAALYMLCVKEGSGVQPSDLYVLACAFCFAIHIMIIDKVSPKLDGVRLSSLQFFVAGVIALIPAVLTEEITVEAVRLAAPSVAFAGIMSSGVAYTLQILGQQKTEPTIATMIMSLESVFGVITAMIVLHQIPTWREAVGCVLMFAAIIVAQLPERKKN